MIFCHSTHKISAIVLLMLHKKVCTLPAKMPSYASIRLVSTRTILLSGCCAVISFGAYHLLYEAVIAMLHNYYGTSLWRKILIF